MKPLPLADGPSLESARWEVTALGAEWMGSLTTTWTNKSAGPLAALPRLDLARLSASEAALVRGDGTRQAIPLRGYVGRGEDREAALKAATLVPFERVTLEVNLRGTLRTEEDGLHLELPPILGRCPPGEAPARLEARVEVVGGGKQLHAEDGAEFIATSSGTDLVLELEPGAAIDDRSLHVAWSIERSDEVVAIARSRPGSGQQHEVRLMITAPSTQDVGRARPKDIVFVLDTSGSMSGDKLPAAVGAIESCLDALRPADTFSIVAFEKDVETFAAASVVASEEHLRRAREWLGQRRAGGCTLLDRGLRAGLDVTGRRGAHRLLVVVTDARVGDAAAAEETLRDTLGEARLLIVLVGEDGDLDQARRMAEVGRGDVIAAGVETLTGRMTSLLEAFSSPVAWDLSIDWGPVEPRKVVPLRPADLYAGRPLSMHAILDGPPPAKIRVVGSTAEGEGAYELVVDVAADAELRQR